MAGAAAAALVMNIPARSAAAPAARIDIHHHLPSPALLDWFSANGMPSIGMTFSVSKSIEDMDKNGVTAAVLSSFYLFNKPNTRAVAREWNEFAARQMADHPGRFGFFALLPLPDVEGSLIELAYALDVLKADGIGLHTSFGDQRLNDPMFTPMLEELNRRKAVVYVHPNAPACCSNLHQPNIDPSLIEYGTDTTRALAGLVFSGVSQKFPDIRAIFSHAGGTLPYLMTRFINQAKTPALAGKFPEGVEREFQRFYYDVAQAYTRGTLLALRTVAPLPHILFGTDFPFRTGAETLAGLKSANVFKTEELKKVFADNALHLLPRFQQRP
jgi:predicted TIM-barrel fold metal-dependent hydrolase